MSRVASSSGRTRSGFRLTSSESDANSESMLSLAPILASGVFVARSIAVRRRREDIDAPDHVDGDDDENGDENGDENDALDDGEEAADDFFSLARPVDDGRRRRSGRGSGEDAEPAVPNDGHAASTSDAWTTSAMTTTEDATGLVEDDDDDDEAPSDAPCCRFCFEERGNLVSPCACAGTAGFVHVECLRRWQKVSLQSHGTEETACRVCGETFTLPKAPALQRLGQWFAPGADDRVAQYGRVWLQMMMNTALPGEETEPLTRAAQLLPLVSCAELRIWARREIRKGNQILRALARFSNACEWTHSLFVLLYVAVAMSGTGIDMLATPSFDGEGWRMAERRPLRRVGQALLALCTGPLNAAVQLTAPLHHFVHVLTLYPSYSLAPMGDAGDTERAPAAQEGPRRRIRDRHTHGHGPRLHFHITTNRAMRAFGDA